MTKEDKKPLKYMTNGIVAMNFCQEQKGEVQNEVMLTNVT